MRTGRLYTRFTLLLTSIAQSEAFVTLQCRPNHVKTPLDASSRRQSFGNLLLGTCFWVESAAALSGTTSIEKQIQQSFPGAVTNAVLVDRASRALKKQGLSPSSTLLTTSFCSDEVNRPLEQALAAVYGDQFCLGGLAGFAFAGVTGLAAMLAHVPPKPDACAFVVYGPHIGIDGRWGMIGHRGRRRSCCGSAIAAANYIAEHRRPPQPDILDAEQSFVTMELMPYKKRLQKAPNAMVELPFCMFDAQNKVMKRIVNEAQVGGKLDGKRLILLGGIQINTPVGESDYFLPLRFEIINANGSTKGLLMDSKLL